MLPTDSDAGARTTAADFQVKKFRFDDADETSPAKTKIQRTKAKSARKPKERKKEKKEKKEKKKKKSKKRRKEAQRE